MFFGVSFVVIAGSEGSETVGEFEECGRNAFSQAICWRHV